MNCPKCGKSLWFVKSFCPFCKTKIVTPPRLPDTPLPLFHWVMLGAWAVWFGHLVFTLATDRSWREPQLTAAEYGDVIASRVSMPIFVGIAGWLGWRLYKRPTRRVTIWFVFVCVTLVWKSWIGPIVMHMSPAHDSVFEGIAWWWSVGRVSVKTFLFWLLPPQILLLSIIVWPAYCWRTQCLKAS
jgi:hypothetical protein